MKKFMFVLTAVFFLTAAVSAYACCGGCGSTAKADISKSSQATVDASESLKADAKSHDCKAACKTKSASAVCCDAGATCNKAKCSPKCSSSCSMIQKSTAKKASIAKHICDAKCGNSCMAMSQSSDKNADATSTETAK